MTYSERLALVKRFQKEVVQRFPMTDQYNILVFGSFLTDRYTSQSDIDLGIFSLSPALSFRLYSYTKDFFDQMGMENDVVRMRLIESQFINLSIVLGQTYTITDYCPPELITYIKTMIRKYGDSPQEACQQHRMDTIKRKRDLLRWR